MESVVLGQFSIEVTNLISFRGLSLYGLLAHITFWGCAILFVWLMIRGKVSSLTGILHLMVIIACFQYTSEFFSGCLCQIVLCHTRSWVIDFSRFLCFISLLICFSIALTLRRKAQIFENKLSLFSLAAAMSDMVILSTCFMNIFTQKLLVSGLF